MNRKDYITNELNLSDKRIQFSFNPPATVILLNKLKEHFLLAELPGELIKLYSQTNGVDEVMEGVGKIGKLIWPVEKVIETNLTYRNTSNFKELYRSFEHLLFIADAGNGDLFGFEILDGKFERNDIFVWNHEADSRTWVAPNLSTFIAWWNDGTTTV